MLLFGRPLSAPTAASCWLDFGHKLEISLNQNTKIGGHFFQASMCWINIFILAPHSKIDQDLSVQFHIWSKFTAVVLYVMPCYTEPSYNHCLARFLSGNCNIRAHFRFAPNQWETPLQSNAVSHRLGANLESALNTEKHPVSYLLAIGE